MQNENVTWDLSSQIVDCDPWLGNMVGGQHHCPHLQNHQQNHWMSSPFKSKNTTTSIIAVKLLNPESSPPSQIIELVGNNLPNPSCDSKFNHNHTFFRSHVNY